MPGPETGVLSSATLGQQPPQEDIEILDVAGAQRTTEPSFDVADVHSGHSPAECVACLGEFDEYDTTISLALTPLNESALYEACDDSIAGTVGDEEVPGKLPHPNRAAVNADLVEHVVVVK